MTKPVEWVYDNYFEKVGTPNTDDGEHFDDDPSDMVQRQAPQNPDTMADNCQCLSDEEIREFLQWDQLKISEDLRLRFHQLCCDYRDIFACSENIGMVDILQHSIDTEGKISVKSWSHRRLPEKIEAEKLEVKKMLEKGVTEPLKSP